MATRFWNFKEGSEGANPQLLVYGDIFEWWGDVQARDFAEQLNAISAQEIDVRINSNGGEVFTAQAIYSSLKRHPAKINVYIDGIAASAATIIAMAGDRIVMPENAMLMIHSPLASAFGNAEELRGIADVLDKVRETIMAVYREQSGLDDEKLVELMAKDTYLTAAEALELGLVDEVSPPMAIAASRRNSGMYVVNGLTLPAETYNKLPLDWRNAALQAPTPGGPAKQEGVKMTLDELKEKHPELYAQAMDAGRAEERTRIKAIEDMAMPGHADLVAQAKFDTCITAEQFAVEVVRAEKEAKAKFRAKREADAAEVNKVAPSAVPAGEGAKEERKAQVVNQIAGAITARNQRAREVV